MGVYTRIKAVVPKPVRHFLRPVLAYWRRATGTQEDKHTSELAFWQGQFDAEGGRLGNGHYRKLMLGIAGEPDESFLAGKVVADFGCGPRGSMVWLSGAKAKIGIDVLVPIYADAFPNVIRTHDMIYVTSTEHVIPMPSASVDVLFTMNALDHTDDLQSMCDEFVRILKPGGELIGSFNLNEPASPCEPQCLTEELLDSVLLNRFEAKSIRFGRMQHPETYAEMYGGTSTYKRGKEGYMWFRGSLRPDVSSPEPA